jgi:ureidoglycolate dehydrogenase (NAD+)
MKTIHKTDIVEFSESLLVAGGFPKSHAEQTADVLVWANLRGIDSHGVLRIPRYVEMVELGIINPDADPKFIHNFGATALIDAEKAPGSVGMNLAARTAMELSRDHGIGWCSARNIGHSGAIGYYAQQISSAGMVGIVMTSSSPLMNYYGSRTNAVSTNPIAISAPTSKGNDPIILDMSTAAVAHGKITAAKDSDREIPLGWGVDENGVETTDPSLVKGVLPAAGAKGSGLSLMIEILGSVLAGNALIAPTLLGKNKKGFNGLVLSVAPQAFGDPDEFVSSVDELAGAIKGLPAASGFDQVLLPGQRGFATAESREADGIPLADGTAFRLVELARKLDITIPAELIAED